MSSVLIVGTVSEVAKTISSEIPHIMKAFGGFDQIEVFLVESDSKDNTIEELFFLKTKFPKLHFAILGNLKEKIPDRIERIRYCRNIYVDYVRENFSSNNWNYIVVMDLDGMNMKLTRKGVDSCFLNNLKWSGVFANQKNGYYDLLALRHKNWMPNNCFQDLDWYKMAIEINSSKIGKFRNFFRYDSIKSAAIWSKMIKIPEQARWIEVESAFGGMGIYKSEIFLKYDYTSSTKNSESEHISLHSKFDEIFEKKYINPTLINSNWNEYNLYRIKFFRFMLFLKNLL
jgi:hypothetical protein